MGFDEWKRKYIWRISEVCNVSNLVASTMTADDDTLREIWTDRPFDPDVCADEEMSYWGDC